MMKDSDTEVALSQLVEIADNISGQYRPEFELGYWAGVPDDAESWYVRFEGDISGGAFTVLGHSAAEVLLLAASEAQARAL